ncbi:transposase [Dactylosporangium cerinum]|uniref:Transposase n=1 Tax=Dactylosporangium cerinum TaxID=1434730 RepID=A0ABV9WL70_9ACTN
MPPTPHPNANPAPKRQPARRPPNTDPNTDTDPDPGTSTGHRRRTPAVNLLARLSGFTNDVLRFAHDLRVAFDNNLAERDIRMVKLRQNQRRPPHLDRRPHLLRHPQLPHHTHRHGLNALTQLHNGHTWIPTTT